MPFTINGADYSQATFRFPRFGCWTAEVDVVGPLALLPGARVSLVVGDLVMVGTVLAAGTFAEQASVSIVGGAGGWARRVAPRTHRSDMGVTVAEVAAQLAADAGELGAVVEAGAERPLGYEWARFGGLASDALQALTGPAWWVAADGITHVGQRPRRPISPATATVQSYDPAIRRAVVSLSDDAVAQLLPGAVLTLSALPEPLEIGGTTIRVSGGAVEADILGERPASELLGAIVEALAARHSYASPRLYQVLEHASGRTSARPAGAAAAASPEAIWIDPAFGLPGASAVLQAGALVVVAALDGSPGARRVVGYLPGTLPAKIELDAEDEIRMGGASAVSLAKTAEVNIALAAVWSGCGGSGPAPQIGGTSVLKGR